MVVVVFCGHHWYLVLMWLVHVNHLHVSQQLATCVHSEVGMGGFGRWKGGMRGGGVMAKGGVGGGGCVTARGQGRVQVGSLKEGTGITGLCHVLLGSILLS